ncbi:mechanosensitive ion channel family protein [Ekhidna sp. To15]|uniref:mechanosensitive ion channel family protein n=1 Tax=Ekhidna sp. To15 TaxID=3395267 RepID=UPI003F524291
MEKITDLTQVGFQSLVALGESFMSALPNILGALFLLLLGWVIARITSYIVRKTLKAVRFDKLSEKLKLDELLSGTSLEITPSRVVGKFVYWVIILLFFVTASDTLGWTVVSRSISDLISYLPQLFSAIVIFVVGFYIASFVRKGLKGILESLGVLSFRAISGFAFYLILVIVTITSLNQAGVDTALVTSNVTIIIGGIILAFAVSFGLGSRDILTNILSSFYTKNNFKAGQELEMSDLKGTIQKIDITSCTLKTSSGIVIVPVKRLLTETVKLK